MAMDAPVSVYPPSFPYAGSGKTFITEDHPQFEPCFKTSYKGFIKEESSELPDALHTGFRDALDALDEGGVFQYDVTQPMGPGTPLAVTKVTRTCVGDPGITYKYLGLRMFAHPWTDAAAQTDTSAKAVSDAYATLRKQNETLDARSQDCLTAEGKGGSTRFSLTLINRMDPTGLKPDLKDEPEFGMGKVSVSWHADSSLVHESTIAGE